MRRSLPFSMGNLGSVTDNKTMVLALSRVEASLEEVSDRHKRMLLRMKNQEKIVDDMLEQLSQRQAATLRYLADVENDINEKLAAISKKQEEVLKKLK
jgi:hypothetical protein